MPYKVSEEEKIVELAILKAKEVLMELTGETVKPKRPNKNPKEVKVKNPVGEEGYGLAGQISKMQQIHKSLKNIIKSDYPKVGLSPRISSNEADPSNEDDRPRFTTRVKAQLREIERAEKAMDKLFTSFRNGKITDRQYVDSFKPLLDRLQTALSSSNQERPSLP